MRHASAVFPEGDVEGSKTLLLQQPQHFLSVDQLDGLVFDEVIGVFSKAAGCDTEKTSWPRTSNTLSMERMLLKSSKTFTETFSLFDT